MSGKNSCTNAELALKHVQITPSFRVPKHPTILFYIIISSTREEEDVVSCLICKFIVIILYFSLAEVKINTFFFTECVDMG